MKICVLRAQAWQFCKYLLPGALGCIGGETYPYQGRVLSSGSEGPLCP